MKKLCLLLLVTSGLGFQAVAAGDPEAGKEKSMTCAACHGQDGNAMVDIYPKIAGQHESYIAKQLHDFRQGAKTGGEDGRYDPVMSAQAANLSDQDIADLAAFYSQQEEQGGEAPEDLVEAGLKLYQGGDEQKGIVACTACHGPRGNGVGTAKFPDISGQHAAYIKGQLEKFRDDQRNNDMNGMMRDVAKRLSDEDIELLSKFLSGLY